MARDSAPGRSGDSSGAPRGNLVLPGEGRVIELGPLRL